MITTGHIYGLIGAALAIILSCIGSSIAVGKAGQMAGAIMSKDPSKFTSAMILTLLPSSQSLYGLIVAFLAILQMNILGEPSALFTTSDGISMLLLCLPAGVIGLVSALFQGKVAMTGMELCLKQEGQMGRAIIFAAFVEIFAIFSLVISLVGVTSINPTGVEQVPEIVETATEALRALI